MRSIILALTGAGASSDKGHHVEAEHFAVLRLMTSGYLAGIVPADRLGKAVSRYFRLTGAICALNRAGIVHCLDI
jgi:hypothetical protein